MTIVSTLTEKNKITKAIDSDNFNQIIVDKDAESRGGFNLANYKESDEAKKFKMLCDLMKKWRKISQLPKIENALMDIYNEAIVADSKNPIQIDVSDLAKEDGTNAEKKVKEMFERSFSYVMKKLRFKKNGVQIFKDWYVDGRLYVYTEYNKKEGIKEIRVIDPMKLELVSKGKKDKMVYKYKSSGQEFSDQMQIFNPSDKKGVYEIPYKNVIFIPSGLVSPDGLVISYLNKALRPVNLLQLLENSLVVQRFVRAPERLVFNVDVSGMNEKKAKSYMQRFMNKYRSRFNINAVTGELNSENMTMAMQENFYLPKTGQSRAGGHDINSIGGQSRLGEIDDILIWKDEVKNALNVPDTEREAVFSFGSRLEEITRSEYKFFRFVKWLRSHFERLFIELMRKHLVNSNQMKDADFNEYIDDIDFVYENDHIYTEAKKKQKIEMKLEMLQNYGKIAERWFGVEWVYKNILGIVNEKEMKKNIDNKDKYDKENEDNDGGGRW